MSRSFPNCRNFDPGGAGPCPARGGSLQTANEPMVAARRELTPSMSRQGMALPHDTPSLNSEKTKWLWDAILRAVVNRAIKKFGMATPA
jgi:hypothetical protein